MRRNFLLQVKFQPFFYHLLPSIAQKDPPINLFYSSFFSKLPYFINWIQSWAFQFCQLLFLAQIKQYILQQLQNLAQYMQKFGNNESQPPLDRKNPIKDKGSLKVPIKISKPTMESVMNEKGSNEQSYVLWGQNEEISYFDQYLKKLCNKEEATRLQSTLFKRKSNFKSLYTNPLELFRMNQSKEDAAHHYDKIKRNPEIMGFSLTAKVKYSPELDNLFIKLIETSSNILQSNKGMCSKIIKRYIQQSSFVKKCYFSKDEIEFEPKMEVIKSFLKNNTAQINVEGVQFLLLLEKITDYYYIELNSCILALSQILNYHNVSYLEGFKKIFTQEEHEESLLKTVWEFYKEICDSILAGSQFCKEYFHNENAKGFIDKLYARKTMTLIHMIKLFYLLLTVKQLEQFERKGESLVTRAFKNQDYDIFQKMIQTLDRHITQFQKIDMSTIIKTEMFSKFLTELFLAIFPFKAFRDKGKEPYKYLTNIKSEALAPIEILLNKRMVKSNRGRANEYEIQSGKDMVRKLQQLIDKGMCNISTYQWKKWIGIFLERYEKCLDKHCKKLTNLIILACKTIIKEDYFHFWDQQNQFYIENIRNFILNAVQGNNKLNVKSILPLFTKLISKINHKKYQHYYQHLKQTIGIDPIRDVFDNVRNHLHVHEQYRQNQQEMIIYKYDRDKQEYNIEQEIKFICQVITINISSLGQVQKEILQLQESQSLGLKLMIQLVQFMQAIYPENESNIKCLRYIINTIDKLFVCEETRNCMRIALARHENYQKKKYAKTLKNILEVCGKYEENTQLGRQSKKLQGVVSEHLNHIVKISNSLEEYFPTQSYTENHEIIRRICQRQHEEDNLQQRIKQLKNGISVSWFYYLALSLQKDELSSMDLDTIRLLLLKLRVKNDTSKEFRNLESIVQILNNSHIQRIIKDYLTPIIKGESALVNTLDRNNTMLGITNLKYESFVASKLPQDLVKSSDKYKNKNYKIYKNNKLKEREKEEVYRKLCAILMMIETILKLTLESDYPLLMKLKLHAFITSSLLEQPYVYSIKYLTKLKIQKTENSQQKSNFFRFLSQNNKTEYQDAQIQGSITMLHSIAMLLDYQHRNNIDQSSHPSKIFRLKGIFILKNRFINKQEELIEDIWFKSQESIFSEHYKRSQSLGITTVLKISQYVMMLGYGKQLFYSIMHRNHLIVNQYYNGPAMCENVGSYVKHLMFMLKREEVTIYQKEHILSFLSLCIQDHHFQKYIINHMNVLKDSLEFISRSKILFSNDSHFLLSHFLYLINLILNKTDPNHNLRTVATCLSDPIKFAKSLFKFSQKSLKQLNNTKLNETQDDYSRLYIANKIKEVTACRFSLLLFLNVASYFLCGQIEIISKLMGNIILECYQTIIAVMPTFNQNDVEFQDCSHQYYTNFIKNIQFKDVGYLKIDNFVDTCFVLHSPFSIINNFKCLPYEIYEKQLQSVQKAKKKAMKANMCNLQDGLRHTNESLIQFYYLILLSLMNRGKHGYFFTEMGQEKKKYRNNDSQLQSYIDLEQSQYVSCLFFMKERTSNMLSFDNLFENTNNLSQMLINLLSKVEEEIWKQEQEFEFEGLNKKNRDIALLLMAKLLSIFLKSISQQENTLIISQCSKIIPRLTSYFITNPALTFSITSLTPTLHQLLTINYHLLSRNIIADIKNPQELYCTYLKNTNNCIQSIIKQGRVNFEQKIDMNKHISLLNFFSSILSIQINHMEAMEDLRKLSELKIYLHHRERKVLMDKIGKMLNYNITVMKNQQTYQNKQYLIRLVQLFNKTFYLEHLSKPFGIPSQLTHQFLFELLDKLEHYYIKQRKERGALYMPSIINEFLAEIYLYSEQQITRNIFKVILPNANKYLQDIAGLNNIKTLQDIDEIKSILSLFISIAKDENWSHIQYKGILNNTFLKIQQATLTIVQGNVTYATQFQKELAESFVYEDRYERSNKYAKEKKSVHEIIVLLRYYSLCKSYVLFIMSSLKNSQLVLSFCDQTFHTSQLDEQTWKRIKYSIANCLQFMLRFLQLSKHQYLSEVIKINKIICEDGYFIQKLQLYPFFYDNYEDKQDFISDILDTLMLFYKAVQMMDNIWQRNQWKSTIQWKNDRKQLYIIFNKVILKYHKVTKNILSEHQSSKIQQMKENVILYINQISI